MRHKLLQESPGTRAMTCDTGDESAANLKQLATEQKLASSRFQATGALPSVKPGWYDPKTKKHQTAVALDEQLELLSLIGGVTLKDGEPQVHAHPVVGKADGTAHGGHLLEARLHPTCEAVLTKGPQHLQKRLDPESGLALIRL